MKMPKAKSKSSGRASQTQSQHNVEQTQGQSATPANKAAALMSNEEQETRINDLVKYMLIMDQKKLPIKRGDITKNVLKEHSRAFSVIMEKAKDKLTQVFGLEVVELHGKQQKSYILVNRHQTAGGEVDGEEPPVAGSEEDHQRTGLLMVILSTIFMNNNVMPDTLLYNVLKQLGVDAERPHPVFGSLANMLKDFERQCYLEKMRIPNSDPATYEFRWGPRAQHELSKRKCLDFVTKIYGMEDASQWTSQWADVNRGEGGANGQES